MKLWGVNGTAKSKVRSMETSMTGQIFGKCRSERRETGRKFYPGQKRRKDLEGSILAGNKRNSGMTGNN